MLKKIALGLLVAAVLGAVYLLTSLPPPEFRYSRSTTIAAPPPVVFARINDLHQWSEWNPFEKSDPTTKVVHSGAEKGVGASYDYTAEKAGAGRMTIVRSEPNRLVGVKAEFKKPFEATHDIGFTLRAQPDGGTELTWSMAGTNNFSSRVMARIVDVDAFIGGEFDKGLADLKRLSEADEAKSPYVTESDPLVLTRDYAAPASKLWRAVTEPTELQKWWAPKGASIPSLQVDLRPGGSYASEVVGQNGVRVAMSGVYRAVEPERRFELVETLKDEEGASFKALVTYVIESRDDGSSKLTVTHAGLPEGTLRRILVERGWNEALEKLDAALKE